MNDVSIKEFYITPKNIQYYFNRELAPFGISFSGALFLSLVENHLSTDNLKTALKGVKIIVAFPLGIAELVTNGIVGSFEKLIINESLTFMVLLID